MPIYMDRHDVSEMVTAENVAQIHQEDLKIQDQFGCRGLTYWFDDKRKTAFCLIEAPDENKIKEMHNKAHGQVPHHIIEVEASIVESFLGRIEDPEKAKNTTLNIINDPAFRTIMVVDLKQFFPEHSITSRLKSLMNHFNSDLSGILNSYGEKPVKQVPDHWLISFRSVSDAVHAALDIQSKFKKSRGEIKDHEIFLKISLSSGVPVTEKKSIFEETIKLAEWMCEIIDAEIVVSSEVKDLYKSENSNRFIKGDNIFAVTRKDEKFLNLLMHFIETNWTNPNLKVDDFTRPVGCSKSQLYRKLTALTGKSPNTFLNDYRLAVALKLLNKNESNVSEIAFETGFTSPSYFSKCFQKKYGHLPSDYLYPGID